MWFLLVALAFLLVVIFTFVAGGLAFTTTLGAVDTTAVGVLMLAVITFGVAVYLSAKKWRNASQRSTDQEPGKSAEELKHASATASTRQAVEEESAWS